MSIFILNLDHMDDEIKPLMKSYGMAEYTEKMEASLLMKYYGRIVDTNALKDAGVSYVVVNPTAARKGIPAKLKEQGILSFVRIDSGHLDAGMPKTIDYNGKLAIAKESGAIGVKIRAYVDNIDSIDMMFGILINGAYKAKKEKLLPIFEIIVKKEWDDKSDREDKLLEVLFDKLQKVIFDCIITVSLPEEAGKLDSLDNFEIVKVVAASDLEQTQESYIAGLDMNNLAISARDTVLDGIKIQMDDNKLKAKLVENINKIKG